MPIVTQPRDATDEEVYERCKSLKEELDCTWSSLLDEMMNTIEKNNLKSELQTSQSAKKDCGMCKHEKRTQSVLELAESKDTSGDIQERMELLLSECYDEDKMLGKTPRVLAAGFEYYARRQLHQKKSQRIMSEKYGCSEEAVGLTNREIHDLVFS